MRLVAARRSVQPGQPHMRPADASELRRLPDRQKRRSHETLACGFRGFHHLFSSRLLAQQTPSPTQPPDRVVGHSRQDGGDASLNSKDRDDSKGVDIPAGVSRLVARLERPVDVALARLPRSRGRWGGIVLRVRGAHALGRCGHHGRFRCCGNLRGLSECVSTSLDVSCTKAATRRRAPGC
jgi:hypothetical protein